MTSIPLKGDVWRLRTVGSVAGAQTTDFYCLVVSTNQFNETGFGLFLCIPLSDTDRGLPLHVEVPVPRTKTTAYAKCEELRCLPISVLDEYCGQVDSELLLIITDRLRILLDL